MKLRDVVVKTCLNEGLSSADALVVLDKVMSTMEEMTGRWDDDTEDYTRPLLALIVMGTKDQVKTLK